MSFKKFGADDIILNTMKAHPKSEFFIFDGAIYYNNIPAQSGSRNSEVRNVPSGFISLYEYNIDRPLVSTGRFIGKTMPDNGRIYPFITKDSANSSFRTLSELSYATEFQYGDILSSSYPLSASITREIITNPSSSGNTHFLSLQNKLNFYGIRSEHYLVSSSFGNKNTQTLNLISIPSIFFGSKIKPGSLSLKWYFTGSLIGELRDTKQNGELIQYGPAGSTGSGSVAGVALYDEGFVLLTGSWALNGETIGLTTAGGSTSPAWLYFGAGAQDSVTQDNAGADFVSASFDLSFKGITETQVMTMFAHARKGEANFSNNPTFLTYGENQLLYTSSQVYQENPERTVVNIVSSSYTDYSASFKRQVYISRICLYDDNKNLIGVATLANPVLKKEDEDISFKLKLDI